MDLNMCFPELIRSPVDKRLPVVVLLNDWTPTGGCMLADCL